MSSIPFVSFCLRTDMEESYETFEEELGPTRKDSLPQKPVRQFRQPGGDTRWQPLTHAICNGRTCDKIRLMLTTRLQAKLYIPIQATETWSLVRCATVIMCLSCPRDSWRMNRWLYADRNNSPKSHRIFGWQCPEKQSTYTFSRMAFFFLRGDEINKYYFCRCSWASEDPTLL